MKAGGRAAVVAGVDPPIHPSPEAPVRRPLLLHHELLLLALCDRKGTLAFGQLVHLGLGGALLTELLLAGKVEVVKEGGRRAKEFVEVRDRAPTGDPILDAALARIRDAKRRASPAATVSRLGGMKNLRHDVARELCRRGVLRAAEDQVLRLFRRRVYPTLDPGPERELVGRIRGVLEEGRPPDQRTAAILALADATGTLRALYDRRALRGLKPRLKEVEKVDVGGRAARQAIAAAQAAVAAAVAAAAASAG